MSAERPASDTRAVARSSAVMAAGTLTSRILGLVRVSLLSGIIGTTGLTAEAFQVANTLPNQFYLILAGGMLNAVLVPQIVRAEQHQDGGHDYVNRLVTLSLLLLVGATVLTVAAGPWLVRAYFDTTDAAALQLSVTFAFVCLPQIFFYGLYTVLGQILTARNRFAAFMWAPVVANVVALAGLVLFLTLDLPAQARPGEWTPLMIAVLAGSATLSIAMQAIVLVVPLRRIGFRYRPTFGFRGVGLRSASNVAKWTFAAVLVAQLGFVVTSQALTNATDRAGRGHFVPGRASFDIAFLLFMLPHSLVTVSLVTALFTRMSKAVAGNDRLALRRDLTSGLRLPAVLLIPAVVVGITFAPLLVQAFLVRNSRAETDAVAIVAMALFLGVVPYGWVYLSERFFYAHEDARTPFLIQVVITALSTAGSLVGRQLDPGSTAVTIAVAQSVAYAVGGTIGFTLIRRRVGALGLGSVFSTYARLLLPAVVTAVGLAWLVRTVLPGVAGTGRPGIAVVALACSALVLLVTWGCAHLLKVPEVNELVGPVVRRLRRR